MKEGFRVEMLWLCAAAYGTLPVLNALTTQRYLLTSLGSRLYYYCGSHDPQCMYKVLDVVLLITSDARVDRSG